MSVELEMGTVYATQFEIYVYATEGQTNDLCAILRSQLLAIDTAKTPGSRANGNNLRRIIFALPDMFEIDEKKVEEWLSSLHLHDAIVNRK